MLLPATSPQTRSPEGVRIDDPSDSHLWTAVPGTTIGTRVGNEASEILDLVADLPAGDIARCFIPGYGIRARSADQLLFEIAFCFRCNNALIFQQVPHQRRDFIGFNGDSRQAQDLLT